MPTPVSDPRGGRFFYALRRHRDVFFSASGRLIHAGAGGRGSGSFCGKPLGFDDHPVDQFQR